ncbi:exosortase/archaeosortase family protein [Porticoccus sp. GXU_MW_L64]
MEAKKSNRVMFLQVSTALSVVIAVMVFWQTIQSLHLRWVRFDEAYSHGYLVVLIAIYLTWIRRRSLKAISIRPMKSGHYVVFLASVLWSIGYISFTEVLQQLALPLMLWGGMLASMGARIARCLLIPVGLLYFAVPIWDVLVYPLRLLTTYIVSWWLGIQDIPAFIDGFRIYLPSGIVEVAGGCSGLNYVMVGIFVGFCYSELGSGLKCHVASVITALVLSVLANWIRVISLVLIAYYTEMRHPLISESHVNFGWYIFSGVLLIFFLIMRFLSGRVPKRATLNTQVVEIKSSVNAGSAKATGILAVLVSIALPVYVMNIDNGMETKHAAMAYSGGEKYSVVEEAIWLPDFYGYDRAQQWRMADFTVTALTYGDQRQGKELIYQENRLAHEAKARNYSEIVLPGGQIMQMSVVDLNEEEGLMVAIWTYRIGDWYTTSQIGAKMLQVPAFLLGKKPSAYLVFSMKCMKMCDREIDRILKCPPYEIEDWLEHLSWSESF